jgi:DNA anti-recombination protein RmuC
MAGENEVPQSEGYAYFELGRLLWKMGKRKQAIENAENALEKFETIQDFYTSRTKQLLKKWRNEERVELAPAKAKKKNTRAASA